MHVVRNLGLRILSFLLGALGVVTFTGVIVVLCVPILNAVGRSYNIGLTPIAIRYWNYLLKPELDFLHAHVPCTVKGFDLAPLLIAGVLLAVCVGSDAALHRVRVYRLSLIELRKAAEKEEAERAGRLAAGDASDLTKRDKVLELYAQTKKILEDQKRSLAFLSVDVVDSTGMKKNEDPALAELDFRRYRKFVDGVLAERKALKSAWTPDGAMICFAAVPDAVQAGQDLILGLRKFNLEVKSVKSDFKIRCGINAGDVLFDDSMKMEEMSDGNIDLAGHMQKAAAPDSIYVGGHVVEGLPSKLGFRPANKQVDGRVVYEWRADFARSSETSPA